MNSAQFVISIDVGSTYIKAALFQQTSASHQQLIATTLAPVMAIEQTLTESISQLQQVAKSISANAKPDLVLIGHPPDIPVLAQANSVTKLSHEEALSTIVRRMSSSGTIVAIDIGSRRTMVSMGRYGKTTIESFPYGVGLEIWNVLRRYVTSAQVKAWTSYDVSEEEIENYVANKSIHPQSIPTTPIEVAIEQTVATLIMQRISEELSFPWSDIQQILLSGSILTQAPLLEQSIMMMLNGLQPLDSVQVYADTTATLYACGGAFDHWSSQDYRIARAILSQTLTSVGTVISFAPDGSKHKIAKITIDTGLSTEQVIEAKANEIVAIPMAADDSGQVEVKSGRKLPATAREEAEVEVIGGEVGLIIDGRSRPLQLPVKDRERRQLLKIWGKQLDVNGRVGEIGATNE